MTKKIDFHIHTIASSKDSNFTFSLDWLKEYVMEFELDCIAITNHDLFDKNNFTEIVEALPHVKVYPGIELSLDIGHVNIVFSEKCIDELSNFSNLLSRIHNTQTEYIKYAELVEMLPCWYEGIYIFEHNKSKSVKVIPKTFDNVIRVWGVSNQFRFNIAQNNLNSLIPCLFSDAHATDNDLNGRNDFSKLKNKQTYLQIDSCDFEDIKRGLQDRTKVSINKENLKDTITIDGIQISSGLNLIVGKRGTGKTFFLNKIKEYIDEECYEIKQFETARADEYIENKKKEKGLTAIQSWSEQYSTEFSKIKSYLNDEESPNIDIDQFLKDVKQYAEQVTISNSRNIYSLFQQTEFELFDEEYIKNALKNIQEVIEKDEIWTLVSNETRKRNTFVEVYEELRVIYIQRMVEYRLKEKVNEVMNEVKSTVTAKIGIDHIGKCSINYVIQKKQLEKKINEFLNNIIVDTPVTTQNLNGYKIKVSLIPYKFAAEFQKAVGTNEAVNDDLIKNYQSKNFVSFLNNLKKKRFYNESNFAEYLVRREVKLLDSEGTPASGGQIVGFALMLKLDEAKRKSIILIDEPESSLDNAYIKNELNSELKELSKERMVVVITHNSTLGTLLEPDYLIVTSKNSEGEYVVKSGEFNSSIVTDITGNQENSYEKFVEAMESGIDSYIKKGEVYENLKRR